jgi:hypothetical protein
MSKNVLEDKPRSDDQYHLLIERYRNKRSKHSKYYAYLTANHCDVSMFHATS